MCTRRGRWGRCSSCCLTSYVCHYWSNQIITGQIITGQIITGTRQVGAVLELLADVALRRRALRTRAGATEVALPRAEVGPLDLTSGQFV